MRSECFEKREEVIKFLNCFGFTRYIPRLKEPMENKASDYYVEITDNNKVNYCSRRYIENGCIYDKKVFYDCNKAYNFPSANEGEEEYIKGIELEEVAYEFAD